jgi:hypothetical protein
MERKNECRTCSYGKKKETKRERNKEKKEGVDLAAPIPSIERETCIFLFF